MRRGSAIPPHLRRLASQFLQFFWSSGVGLIVDYGLYATLTAVGVIPWLANAISAASSVLVVYVLVSRFAYRQRGSVLTLAIFSLWYTASIFFFSWLIQYGVDHFDLHPVLSKAFTLPLSFTSNFIFSRVLFGTLGRPREPRAGTSGHGAVPLRAPGE